MPPSPLIKPLVFGGIDGLTTTLALVWGSMGAGEQLVSASAVLVLGVANLLATALSMGIGDYVGTVAEHEAATSADDPHETHKRGVVVKAAALRSGFTMFASFIAFGGLPLLVYIPALPLVLAQRRFVSTVLCVVSFLALGAVRARMSDGSTVKLAVTMAVVGSSAALASFLASKVIHSLVVGGEPPLAG